MNILFDFVSVACMLFTVDDNNLIVGDIHGNVTMIDVDSGEILHTCKVASSSIRNLELSRRGKYALFGLV